MNSTFNTTFPIRYHELDYRGNYKTSALLHCLQDAAGLHASELGVSVADLRKQGLTWVLSRLHLIINSPHRADQHIHVHTWPSTRKGAFSCREFEICGPGGEISAQATSVWAVVRLSTRKPVKLDDCLPAYQLFEKKAIEESLEPLPTFPDDAADNQLHFRVQRNDLDINGHVNNVVYAIWALETVADTVAGGSLKELDIAFKSEALYGNNILSLCKTSETDHSYQCLHRIINEDDGRELARMKTVWKKQTKETAA